VFLRSPAMSTRRWIGELESWLRPAAQRRIDAHPLGERRVLWEGVLGVGAGGRLCGGRPEPRGEGPSLPRSEWLLDFESMKGRHALSVEERIERRRPRFNGT
jgi:hypothetical protein